MGPKNSPAGVAVYCRISADRTSTGLGVARQEKDCRAWADRRGWPVAQVYTDNDTSAYGAKDRPEYRRMLADLQTGKVDGVIVWHLDRLTRRPIELEQFFDLVDRAGVTNLASVTGDVDLASDDARFLARVVGAAARKESDDKSRRLRRKHLELAERGVAVGGTRPFGYEDDKVTLRPGEAALVREAVTRLLAGETVRGLCVEWNEKGVPASRGGRWTSSGLRRILTNPRLYGARTYKGEVVAEGCWDPIIDRDTFERVRAVLDSRAVVLGPRPRNHLLTGLVVCGKCGANMASTAGSRRSPTFFCFRSPQRDGCGGTRIVEPPLERLVVDRVKDRARSGRFSAPEPDGDLLAEVAAVEGKMERLATDYYSSDSPINDRQFRAASAALERQLVEARGRLAARTRSAAVADADTLPDRWDGMPFDRQVATLGELVESVVIGPAQRGATRFDPGRVTIRWR